MGKTINKHVEFEYTAERWTHPSIEGMITLDELQAKNLQDDKADVKVINLYVEGWSSYTSGYTSGLPEDCYPDEYDSEIEKIVDDDGNDWYPLLSAKELSEINSMFDDKIERSSSYDDECDYYDDYSDRDNYYHPLDDW